MGREFNQFSRGAPRFPDARSRKRPIWRWPINSLKKIIDPADIAALAIFLAGPHARTISGQMFPIDGDSKSST